MNKQKSHEAFYQIKIWLLDSPMPIWRRFIIRSDVPLNMVHEVSQIVMGWYDFHEYEFRSGRRRFSDFDKFPKLARGRENDLEIRLCDVMSEPGKTLQYIYNFVIRLLRHPMAQEPRTTEATMEVTMEVATLLKVVQGEMSRQELQTSAAEELRTEFGDE